MGKFLKFAIAVLCFSPIAGAWTCPAGQHHVQSTKGTPGAVLVEGEYFVCVPDTPVTSPNPSQNQSQSQNQNQSLTNSVNTSVNTTSTSKSDSAATSNSTVKNSGNSSNSNSNTATGGTASSTASATDNGNNSNNSSYSNQTKVEAAAATAFSTAAPTAPCVVGYGFGGQLVGGGLSLSGGKIDKNCAILETARSAAIYANRLAYCKVFITDKWAKKAHVTLEDCLTRDLVPATPVVIQESKQQPQIIVIPQPAPAPIPVPVVQNGPVGTFTDIGECRLTAGKLTNVCNRFLDDAIRRLELDPNARLQVKGPIESTQAVKYLRERVASERVTYKFDDDQNNVVNFSLWSVQ